MKILIAVTTCHDKKYAPRSASQRDTWVPDAKGLADVAFFYGRPERDLACSELHDEVFLDCDDSYMGRPSKIQAVCQWALAAEYKDMLKTDDDVFIDVPALIEARKTCSNDYVGREVVSHGETFASGFGYWLSERAMKVIAACGYVPPAALEDRWVAQVLSDAGIALTADNSRYVACYPGIEPVAVWRLPATRRGVVFCEFQYPIKMHEAHRACLEHRYARRQA